MLFNEPLGRALPRLRISQALLKSLLDSRHLDPFVVHQDQPCPGILLTYDSEIRIGERGRQGVAPVVAFFAPFLLAPLLFAGK